MIRRIALLTMGVAVSALQERRPTSARTEAEGQGQGQGRGRGDEETCGQELARDAEVPESLGRLMAHVATNMDAHARWVGGGPERVALEHVAAAYHAIAEASQRAASAMRAMKDLPAAPHDPKLWDRTGQIQWMRQKIAMQTAFANMILRHARASETALAEMQRSPAPPPK